MESKKNKAPKGVLIAIFLIVAMIVLYFILTMVFPGIFHGLQTGELAPAEKVN